MPWMWGDRNILTPLLLTQREAAKVLSISERTLYTLRKAGLIRGVRIGLGSWRYSIAELERFIQKMESECVENGVDIERPQRGEENPIRSG